MQDLVHQPDLERLTREPKRRTEVVPVFPDDESVIRLVGALLVEMDDEMIAADRRCRPMRVQPLVARPCVPGGDWAPTTGGAV